MELEIRCSTLDASARISGSDTKEWEETISVEYFESSCTSRETRAESSAISSQRGGEDDGTTMRCNWGRQAEMTITFHALPSLQMHRIGITEVCARNSSNVTSTGPCQPSHNGSESVEDAMGSKLQTAVLLQAEVVNRSNVPLRTWLSFDPSVLGHGECKLGLDSKYMEDNGPHTAWPARNGPRTVLLPGQRSVIDIVLDDEVISLLRTCRGLNLSTEDQGKHPPEDREMDRSICASWLSSWTFLKFRRGDDIKGVSVGNESSNRLQPTTTDGYDDEYDDDLHQIGRLSIPQTDIQKAMTMDVVSLLRPCSIVARIDFDNLILREATGNPESPEDRAYTAAGDANGHQHQPPLCTVHSIKAGEPCYIRLKLTSCVSYAAEMTLTLDCMPLEYDEQMIQNLLGSSQCNASSETSESSFPAQTTHAALSKPYVAWSARKNGSTTVLQERHAQPTLPAVAWTGRHRNVRCRLDPNESKTHVVGVVVAERGVYRVGWSHYDCRHVGMSSKEGNVVILNALARLNSVFVVVS